MNKIKIKSKMEYLKVRVCAEQENKDLATSNICGKVVFVHVNDIDENLKFEEVKCYFFGFVFLI